MHRIIPIIIAITLSSCSSIIKFTALGSCVKCKDMSYYNKSSLLGEYSLSEDEYNEWREIISSKAKELATTFKANPPEWKNSNQLYYRNNPLRIITTPKPRVGSIESVLWDADNDSKIGMTLFARDGIYFISCYQKYNETILECKYLNFESLIKWRGRLGEAGNILSEESYKFLQPKIEQLAREAELRKKKSLSEKREAINKKAAFLINNINKNSKNTLVIRELYLGMPAEDCADLLNYYLGLPEDDTLECYEYIEEDNTVSREGDSFGIMFMPQATQNGKVTALYLNKNMVDKILNASPLKPQELAQELVNRFPLVPEMLFDQVNKTLAGNPIYGWKYANAEAGFRISVTERKTLMIESITKSTELTF